MPIALQAFTTPANTQVITDTAAAPGTLPTPAVLTTPSTPLIDGNDAYIWSPNNASGQIVTFRSIFNVPLPVVSLILPISVNYAFAGNQTVTVTATLEALNVLGIVVLTVPLFADSNGGNPQNVEIASGDALIAVALLATTARITVDAIAIAPVTLPYTPPNTGRYLGEITVQTII
ncbi:hypothetical protein ACP8HI_10440 [Paenibacillus sp. FA6]|uniref:hypothetical protein n=1 Tax=Paenibacillus sp. FA6 TaxID=3413029 RepID=UPI003F65D34E